jgi:thiol-disulfide isomerase/thioredoxin
MQGGDLIGAIALVEQAAAAEPANRTAQAQAANALNQLGLQLVNSGDRDGGYATFIKAGTVARVLQKNFSDLNEAERGAIANCLYNEACAHGVGNRPEQALASLKDAVAAGFADASLIGSDADLAVIRDLPEFKDLLEGVGKAQAEAARREALELLASGESFPFDFSLADVDGQTVQLAALKGKVVIVDVWGTWCPPCRAEVPHFVELRNKYAPEEFAIVGINYERAPQDQWVDKIKAGIAELGINYPCVIGDDATRNQIPNFEGFPTTLFIDRTGKVRLKAVGYHDLAHLEALVTALLAEPKPKGGTSGGN